MSGLVGKEGSPSKKIIRLLAGTHGEGSAICSHYRTLLEAEDWLWRDLGHLGISSFSICLVPHVMFLCFKTPERAGREIVIPHAIDSTVGKTSLCYRLPWRNGLGWHLMRWGAWTRRKGTAGREGSSPALPTPQLFWVPGGQQPQVFASSFPISTKVIPYEKCNPGTSVPKTAL